LATCISTTFAEEWVRILHPDSVKIAVSQTRKVVEIESWKARGHKNFVNLSFWGSRGPVGSLYINSANIGFAKRSWPVFSLSPEIGQYKGGDIITGFSGSNILIENGEIKKQPKTYFSKRKCPRTGVGLLPDGKLIVIVTTRANLNDFAKRFKENGAVFAVNVDGGSSSMFIENGEIIWSSKRSAVPVILSW
jgi:exopolysaccharide biosynthesis protein